VANASRQQANTFDCYGPPIILVPGVMGSRIERPNGGYLWDPDDTIGLLGLAAIHTVDRAERFSVKLTEAKVMEKWSKPALSKDVKPAVTEEQRKRGWPGLSWNFYGPGLQDLQRHANLWGGKVYGFGYDWRQSNMESGKRLARLVGKVRNENDNHKVLIVTHSMGGLVTRAACALHGAEADVLGVVHTLQPAFGTPLAYRLFKMGAEAGTPWLPSFSFKGLKDFVSDHVLAIIQGRSSTHYAVTGHGLRGPFELLPNHLFHACTGREFDQDPGIHDQPANSWLTIVNPEVAALRYPVHANHIYSYYGEDKGGFGLINFEFWNSDENRYIFDPGKVLEGADVGSIVPFVGTPAGTAMAIKQIYGPQVADGVRKGILSAKRYHMEDVGTYAHPNTAVIAGTGLETDTGFKITFFASHDDINYKRVLSSYSDGTVSLTSATALKLAGNSSAEKRSRQIKVGGVKHAEAFGENQQTFLDTVWQACKIVINYGEDSS
jgi:pimeloyl-ACP methyl ester carboxylesterase